VVEVEHDLNLSQIPLAPVAIVNDVLARRFWPNQESLGKRIRKLDGQTFEVIGVAKTGKYDTLGEEALPFVYLPLDQSDGYRSELTFHIRTTIPPKPLLDTFRRQLTGAESRANRLRRGDDERTSCGLTAAGAHGSHPAERRRRFGNGSRLARPLRLIGYLLRPRTHEMGIRMALGANPRDLLTLVLKPGMNTVWSRSACMLVPGAAGDARRSNASATNRIGKAIRLLRKCMAIALRFPNNYTVSYPFSQLRTISCLFAIAYVHTQGACGTT